MRCGRSRLVCFQSKWVGFVQSWDSSASESFGRVRTAAFSISLSILKNPFHMNRCIDKSIAVLGGQAGSCLALHRSIASDLERCFERLRPLLSRVLAARRRRQPKQQEEDTKEERRFFPPYPGTLQKKKPPPCSV